MQLNRILRLYSATDTQTGDGWETISVDEFNAWLALGNDAKLFTAEWEEHLQAGWTDAQTGIKLKTTEEARNLFSCHSVLLSQLLAGGIVTSGTVIPIWDYDEKRVDLPVSFVQGLFIRYGIAWAKMFEDFAP